MDAENLLRQGITAARAGQRVQAYQLLVQAVKVDQRNENAWLWLAAVVDDPARQRFCFHQVLELNPANSRARQGLAWLERRTAPAPQPAPAPEPAPAPAPPPLPPTPPPTPLAELQDHCPYCGAEVMHKKHTCPQCHTSLMERSAPNPIRLPALSFLGGLWGLGCSVVVGVNIFGRSEGVWPIIALLGGIIMMGVVYALFQLQRWAYITIALASVLLFIVSIVLDFWPLLLLFFILIPRSYRNFYGKRRRFVPTWEERPAHEHHTAAESYKQREMWYMALKEWEGAVRKEPGNMRYRRAVGTAYVRLKQFDRALIELQAVQHTRPDDPQLHALIEKVAHYAQKEPATD